jgi:diguanylate cyclase (GGDEF)-like protein
VTKVKYKELTTTTDSDFLSILSSSRHCVEVSRERHKLIVSRVQWAAGALSVLTFAWIAIDAYTMSWPLWGILAIGRLSAAVAFWMLMSHRFRGGRPGSAYFVLGALFLIPSAFLLAAHITFQYFPYVEQSIFVSTAYLYAPFLIAVSLSVFPLTALENAILSIPIFLLATVSLVSTPESFGQVSAPATLLRLLLIAGISSIAGMSQLRFLMVLTEQSIRDRMTSALTRSAGEQRISLQLSRAARRQHPMAVLFIDLDRFKSINDQYGHDVGDAVLQQAARSIRETLDSRDTLVRWGGEEFVVLLPRTDIDGARVAVERITSGGLGFRPDGMPVTASIGVAERVSDRTSGPAQLIALADRRMYAAKTAGRNCYVDGNGEAARPLHTDRIQVGNPIGRRSTRPSARSERAENHVAA